jgi:hypothetical protein
MDLSIRDQFTDHISIEPTRSTKGGSVLEASYALIY